MERKSSDTPVIEFRDVAYRLPNGTELLSGLNLQVQRGQTLVLLGRSGSGKTTSLKLINRLLTPSRGEVYVNGAPTSVSRRDSLAARHRLCHSGRRPYFRITRWNATSDWSPGSKAGPNDRIHSRVEELLKLVGLDAGIARAILTNFPADSGSA